MKTFKFMSRMVTVFGLLMMFAASGWGACSGTQRGSWNTSTNSTYSNSTSAKDDEQDYYTITVVQNGTLTISVNDTDSGNWDNLTATLYPNASCNTPSSWSDSTTGKTETGALTYSQIVSSGTYVVHISGSSSDNTNYTFSGAFTPSSSSEINVVGIADGSTDTSFGSTLVTSGTIDRTYTVQNTGTADLTLGTVSAGGDFTVILQPTSTVAAGSSTTFTVRFDPSAVGTRVATISFSNNDLDENPYNFSISAIGDAPPTIGDIPDQTTTVGSSFSLNLSSFVELTNSDPIILPYVLTGTLPAGLTFNDATGVISGTPTTITAASNFVFKASDNDGQTSSNTFTIAVIAPTTNFTCANPKAFEPVYSDNAYSKLVLIGNTSLCRNNNGTCGDPGNNTNNNINMMHNDYDNVFGTAGSSVTTLNSSAALLNIPAGKRVLWAGLFWQGYMAGTWTDAQKQAGRAIKYKHANAGSYVSVTNANMNWVYFTSTRMYYQSFVDVTDYVDSAGPGYYWVGDIATTQGQPIGGSFGAWSMAVVYEDINEEFRNITVFHGYQGFAGADDISTAASYATANSCSTANTGVGNNVSSTLSGFLTPKTGTVEASLAVFAGEGDIGISGDSGSITNKSGTAFPLSNGLNPANNIMNATISKDGVTVTTGLPYYSPNSLGADIDTYNMTGILNNQQTSTNITLSTSNDGYMPGMYALSSKLYVPEFCYDYAYKQQGVYFTEDNDGLTLPRLTGDVLTGQAIETTIFVKNLIASDIAVTDMYLDVTDINTTQAPYISGTTKIAFPADLNPQSISPASTSSSISNIHIGTISSNDYFYLYYSQNPLMSTMNMPINVTARYNLTIAGVTIPYVSQIGQKMPMCSTTGLNYTPSTGIFNVVHNDYYNYNTGGTNRYYNLPTQVASREGNFKVLSLDKTNNDTLKTQSTIVAVELIDAGAFHYTDASCYEQDSSISERIWLIINNSTSALFNAAALNSAIGLNNTITSGAQFYQNARQNAAFRISYNVAADGNDSLVQISSPNAQGEYKILNFSEVVQVVGECKQDVLYPTGSSGNTGTASMAAQACGNSGNYISAAHLQACMECLYGFNTKVVCSRDNFAIRPEAIMIKLDDQDQMNPLPALPSLHDTLSGVTTPGSAVINMAAGYNYNIKATATNHLSNAATSGYTKSFGSIPGDTSQYIWESRSGVTSAACNDIENKSSPLRFVNGYADTNTSVNQVGEYRLNITDTTWTTVDNDPIYMVHHTSPYFRIAGGVPNKDCTTGSTTYPVGTLAGSASPLNGCNISSNHDSSYLNGSGLTLKYRDYNVTFHPYRFDVASVTPTVGLLHSGTGANSYIYMADMNQSQDENMSVHLNGSIIAQGYDGNATSNFVSNCYAKPLDINVSESDTSHVDSNGNNLLYKLRFHDLNATGSIINALDINVTKTLPTIDARIQTTQGYFLKDLNGSMNTILNLNYHRAVNASANPKSVTVNHYKVNCTNAVTDCTFNADLINNKTIQGQKNINATIRHYYGRTNAPKQVYMSPIGTNANPANDLIFYEVFCNGAGCDKTLLQNGVNSQNSDDPRWFINTNHINGFGTAGAIWQKNAASVTATNPTGVHQDSTNLVYDGAKGYPYKATMENNASSWLIYNRYNINDLNNSFEVEFQSGESGWTGIHYNNTNTALGKGAIWTNKRLDW